MDGFTYHNIFETKGMEYLIVIAFLLILVPFWIILNKKLNVVTQFQKSLNVLTANILRIPRGLYYSKNHTWAFLEKSGFAKIGLDDFLLQIVGDIKVNQIKSTGENLNKGELIAEIYQNGKRLEIQSPISGEIVTINNNLSESPEILNQDPYGQGWIYAIKPTNWKSETNSYLMADGAIKWINQEIERFKDFLTVSIGKQSAEPSLVTYQEGGELRRNILSEFDEDIWKDFQAAFLK
ncbi:MAG: hypothetical protein K8R53_15240 [Bacteroidales bacterium]|nr:hypothetical protein [Bacteroidales bacterium]